MGVWMYGRMYGIMYIPSHDGLLHCLFMNITFTKQIPLLHPREFNQNNTDQHAYMHAVSRNPNVKNLSIFFFCSFSLPLLFSLDAVNMSLNSFIHPSV